MNVPRHRLVPANEPDSEPVERADGVLLTFTGTPVQER